jgi:hypothetical protein
VNGAPEDSRAREAYEALHWGIPARRMRRVRPAARPRALAELGKLEAVTYATHKKGDGPSLYEHHFGEEGGSQPSLAVDVDSGDLHIVGGDYTVEDRGIVD